MAPDGDRAVSGISGSDAGKEEPCVWHCECSGFNSESLGELLESLSKGKAGSH